MKTLTINQKIKGNMKKVTSNNIKFAKKLIATQAAIVKRTKEIVKDDTVQGVAIASFTIGYVTAGITYVINLNKKNKANKEEK